MAGECCDMFALLADGEKQFNKHEWMCWNSLRNWICMWKELRVQIIRALLINLRERQQIGNMAAGAGQLTKGLINDNPVVWSRYYSPQRGSPLGPTHIKSWLLLYKFRILQMWRHHPQVWRPWDENVMFFSTYCSVCETEAYRKVLITLVNLVPKAKKEAEHSITPPQMTCTSRVHKLEKMEKAAVTQSRVTGYIFSPGSSIRKVILISYECWSCKLLNDLTPQQCISVRLNLLHNHLFRRRLRSRRRWPIFERFGYDALEGPKCDSFAYLCLGKKLSTLILNSLFFCHYRKHSFFQKLLLRNEPRCGRM